MFKRFGFAVALLGLTAFVVPALGQKTMEKSDKSEAKCTCEQIKKVGCGWCEHCHMGMAGGKALKSEKVYKTVAGSDVPKEIKCKDCAKAAKENGMCKTCGVYFAHGHMYTSPFAYELASGAKVDAKEIKCAACKKNYEAHKDGYCDKCGGGLVHGAFFKGKDSYAKAEAAKEIIEKACDAAAKCESCAMAMLTNSKCATCKVAYKDGKATKS